MRNLSKGILFLSAFLLTTLFPKNLLASEGIAVLKSTTRENFRCFAASVQMMDLSYVIPITCRNLLYPAGENIFNYIVWASSAENGKPIKLGGIGLGRQTFKSTVAFSDIYVTTEKDSKTKTPDGPVVMRGKVQTIETYFAEKEGEEEKEESILEEITPTPTSSSRERLVAGLRRAGLVSALALISLLGLVFVLTRR